MDGKKREEVTTMTIVGASVRDKPLRDGLMVAEGGTVRFTRDHLFRSPSMADVALPGRTASGCLAVEGRGWANA